MTTAELESELNIWVEHVEPRLQDEDRINELLSGISQRNQDSIERSHYDWLSVQK